MRARLVRLTAICAVILAACGGRATPGAIATPSAAAPSATAPADPYLEARLKMVADQMEFRADVPSEQRITDPKVLEAFRKVPRHEFVPEDLIQYAYRDGIVPIGFGQTISQPYIVALMTQLLELNGNEKVLEIGTGSGYQAAILAELVPEVYTIEIIPELAEAADKRLDRLGYQRIHRRQGDGYYGWSEAAPFDAIVVTCAPDHVPPPLLQQLKKDGGRMVIPVGPPGSYQTLWRIVMVNGEPQPEVITGCIFVPLTRGQ